MKILFPPNKTWQQYIDSRRLEITCGEAPYIASRYDASTGEAIPIRDKIGILDRKLRIINEIQTMKKNGLNGQSGLFKAYMDELKKIANIIAWNFWQMDGLIGTVPLGEPEEEIHQYSLFEIFGNEEKKRKIKKLPDAEYLIGGRTSQFYMNP